MKDKKTRLSAALDKLLKTHTATAKKVYDLRYKKPTVRKGRYTQCIVRLSNRSIYKLNYISLKSIQTYQNVMNAAVEAYIQQYEQQHGEIPCPNVDEDEPYLRAGAEGRTVVKNDKEPRRRRTKADAHEEQTDTEAED